MIEERIGEMVFRAGPTDVVVRSPEQLAAEKIYVHPNVMRQNWGPDAESRYQNTIAVQRATPAIGR